MSLATPLDPVSAGIVDRLHNGIAALIHGNQIDKSEVKNVGARSCLCYLRYEVQWHFVPAVHKERFFGNRAVSKHLGSSRRAFDLETAQRCEMGRTHQPIRQQFVDSIVSDAGLSLGRSERSQKIWDFGQHSVHADCNVCKATGRITCNGCYGSKQETCYFCQGGRTTTETRWVTQRNGQMISESYQQNCSRCGASGRLACRRCNGKGTQECSECQGEGFFTDICNVIVDAKPSVSIAVECVLSAGLLIEFLKRYPASQLIRQIDFKCAGHRNEGDDRWLVLYDASTITVELDLALRDKNYTAAAISEQALAFVKPPIFDDVFIEELTDLKKIWSAKKKSFSNQRARNFFKTYSGQPVLDKAMKAVAKLKGKDLQSPESEVIRACCSYVSANSAQLLGRSMIALLEKVSPPNSLWAWIGVMLLPFLLLFLGAQNWVERNAPNDYLSVGIVFLVTAFTAAILTLLTSPIAATMSAIVSAIRRRAVPIEYRQHGRNWQPFKAFVLASIGFASMGAALGLMSHHNTLPRWDNRPMYTIEEMLNLNRLAPYAHTSAWLKQLGFFVSTRASAQEMSKSDALTPEMNTFDPVAADLLVMDIQTNLKTLGYSLRLTGQMNDPTRQAVAEYAKSRKLRSTELKVVLASLCEEMRGSCINLSQVK